MKVEMDESKPKRRRSTNPFDDSSSDEESAQNDVFHDCHDVLVKKREAKLDFDFHSDQVAEEPALRFDRIGSTQQSNTFISPLEAAMIDWTGDEESGDSSHVDYSDGEERGKESAAEDDVPTEQESAWASLIRKASGTLIGSSPAKAGDENEGERGQLSRRGSQSSFVSARSIESVDGRISAESTPTHSRQGSFKGEARGIDAVSPRTRGSMRRRSSMRKSRRRTSATTPAVVKHVNPVLEKLEPNDKDSDFDSPWTKMILLEELGTASSWTVLLLPYIAFIISVLLDTHSPFMVASVGPLNATSTCSKATESGSFNVPIDPAPSISCFYPYELQNGHGLLASGKNSFLLQTFHYKDLMREGIAVTSGPITGVSPMSTFLNGDAFFSNLSTEAVAVVANGLVMVSTVVLQQLSDHAVDWAPVFVSRPERLSLACIPNAEKHEKLTTKSHWNCTSPRMVDVVFPMPGTGVLNGGELQVYLLYSSYDPSIESAQEFFHGVAPYKDANGTGSFVFDESGTAVISSRDSPSDTDAAMEQIVRSSEYVYEHESRSYAIVKITVRLSTLTLTFLFTLFWCWSLGVKGFFLGCCCSCLPERRGDDDTLPLTGRRAKDWMWWESPWIVFPERRYLLILLICLMLIQNPLLAYAYFKPTLYGSATVRTIADIMVGIGVQGYLMMWLFLVQGVRYHTAAFARRRAKHQRQILELRRTAKYLATSEGSRYGSDESYITQYMDDYFEKHGDVEGIRSAGDLAIRLKSDPCGDSWADFLLPKLVLFAIGVASIVVTAICRFPTSTNSTVVLDPTRLHYLNVLYVAGSIIQMFVLLCWVYLILRNTILTGSKLRKEPFLSTRPAQLAYRVLLGMLLLGVGALVVPLVIDLFHVVKKWSLGRASRNLNDPALDRSPIVDVLIKILWKASQKFPYSGTAASIGPGKILFATTIALVSAFIFLPSKPYYEADSEMTRNEEPQDVAGDDSKLFSLALKERMDQKRDKRRVVRLAHHSHTWRTFPLPIKKATGASKILSEKSFRLHSSPRSTVYVSQYMPVFCVEIASWLLEASWQAYYSPQAFSLDDWAPGRMNLESLGLRLEHSIIDESLHTQAYIASNSSPQVDGEEESVIVVAFRGTANSRNMKTDLTFRQVPLFDQIIGTTDDHVTFQVHPDRIEAFDTDGRFWATPMRREADIISTSPSSKTSKQQDSAVFHWHDDQQSTLAAVSSGAKTVIKAVPMARQALPCVHEGFLEAYAHIRQQVLEGVMDVLQRQFKKAVARARLGASGDIAAVTVPLVLPKIYVTGHSLGGSLAQLLALDIASNCELVVDVEPFEQSDPSGADDFFLLPSPAETTASPESQLKGRVRLFSFDDAPAADDAPRSKLRTIRLQPPIAVYTFGQPRLGNHAFARMYKQRVPHTFRIASEGDAFTAMPPTVLCGWSGIYKHAGLEVMLDEGCTGNILVGPTVVETLFRFTKVRTSVAAHSMERYRDGLESAFGQDELEEYYRGHGTLKESRGAGDRSSFELPDWVTHIKRPESEP